jgi:hypothetical protein
MTVLGFNKKSIERVKMDGLGLRSELTANKDSKFVYGLYFNENTPER